MKIAERAMSLEEALRIVRLRWSADGYCATCGYRSSLEEYPDLAATLRINEIASALELRCSSAEGATHLGVRIRYSSSTSPTLPALRPSYG